MSQGKLFKAMLKSMPHVGIIGLSLAWTYFTLGWKVRRTRKAFEKQLIAQGMSKKDAQQLSACFANLKNNLTSTVKQGLTNRGFQ